MSTWADISEATSSAADIVGLLMEFASVLYPIAQGLKMGTISRELMVEFAKHALALASDEQMRIELK